MNEFETFGYGRRGSSDSAIANREQELAAADLAFSLLQDVSLPEAVASHGGIAVVGGEARGAITEVGEDYLRAGELLLPQRVAVVRVSTSPAPRVVAGRFLDVLGGIARAGGQVEVSTYSESFRGKLKRAARDHLSVQTSHSEALIAVNAVLCVRVLSGSGYSGSRGLSG